MYELIIDNYERTIPKTRLRFRLVKNIDGNVCFQSSITDEWDTICFVRPDGAIRWGNSKQAHQIVDRRPLC